VDTHTGGEPTRVVLDGGPALGGGPLVERCARFRKEHARWRAAVVNEPRGSGVLVGALLCEPDAPGSSAAVVFFNNVGVLGMCGHGTIGLLVAMQHAGLLAPGLHAIETPAGVVVAETYGPARVAVQNVGSYRLARGVEVDVPGAGRVTGDVAWGGNWFFLVDRHGLDVHPRNLGRLTDYALRVKDALAAAGIRGADRAPIDHVELFGPSDDRAVDCRNFVLCPGGAYDRSPCGTGTSAKLACLAADGRLAPGVVWRQQSIIGSVFEAAWQLGTSPGVVNCTIAGSAYVTAEATLLLDERDPFCWGIEEAP
jgi:4-hydroxyproline epimerase